MSNLPQQIVGWFKSHFSKNSELDQKSKGDIREHLKWMFPPSDPHSADGWDLFWKNQFEHKVAGFSDLMVHSHQLVEAAQRLNLRTVLYVGPGASLEPFALARAGFTVTARDISPLIGRLGKWMLEHPIVTDEDCKRFLSRNLFCDGGTVQYVVGDLFNQAICPEPYDIIVERKTIQDYPESDQIIAVQRLLQRLAPVGIYLAHCHDNRQRTLSRDKQGARAIGYSERQSCRISNARSPGGIARKLLPAEQETCHRSNRMLTFSAQSPNWSDDVQ